MRKRDNVFCRRNNASPSSGSSPIQAAYVGLWLRDTEVGALIHLEAAEGAASDAIDKICTQVFRLACALDHP